MSKIHRAQRLPSPGTAVPLQCCLEPYKHLFGISSIKPQEEGACAKVGQPLIAEKLGGGGHSYHFNNDATFVDDTTRNATGPSPSPLDVAKAARLATECETDAHKTKARIEPDKLLPEAGASLAFESRMVDFAVYIELEDDTHEHLRELAAQDPFTTAYGNQTCSPPLQKRPLAISFETMLTGEIGTPRSYS
ncbi:hypothetical protein IQ07DRAFT_606457 [Pyrenochaeta sp. DS3sAY3a]|nr:hypothetical protein IQ07DRAFT_606457 [Pyrenochaeta sp. DS3sAY3a]